MLVRVFKYRLYPKRSQRTQLTRWLGICRWVYNKTLEIRRDAWKERGATLRFYDTTKLLPGWKQEQPWLKEVHAQVLQNAQHRVDRAFQGFFRRAKAGEKAGYPRFRGRNRYDSFTFPQSPYGAKLIGSVLRIRKIGNIRLNLHRPIEGKIKTTTVKRTATGKWFVTFVVEIDEVNTLLPTDQAIGIDLGLESFATSDQGHKIQNPRFFRKEERALALAQRRMSAAPKESAERARRHKVVTRVHERIRNRRHNFTHQISRRLVRKYGTIVFEDLKPSNMVKNKYLAKSISDAAWTQLVQQTTYKAEEAGRQVVLVNPAHTSQDCSRCGFRVKKGLSERVHECPACGLVLDRDHNAAINILRLGLQSRAAKPSKARQRE